MVLKDACAEQKDEQSISVVVFSRDRQCFDCTWHYTTGLNSLCSEVGRPSEWGLENLDKWIIEMNYVDLLIAEGHLFRLRERVTCKRIRYSKIESEECGLLLITHQMHLAKLKKNKNSSWTTLSHFVVWCGRDISIVGTPKNAILDGFIPFNVHVIDKRSDWHVTAIFIRKHISGLFQFMYRLFLFIEWEHHGLQRYHESWDKSKSQEFFPSFSIRIVSVVSVNDIQKGE